MLEIGKITFVDPGHPPPISYLFPLLVNVEKEEQTSREANPIN